MVAALRTLSVVIGIFNVDKFKTTLIDRHPELVTPLFGRLFAAWTSVTCALCLICAWNPTNRGVYTATWVSFLVALLFFLSELMVFRTVSLKAALSPMIVASVSALWMGLGFNYYTNDVL